MVIWARFAEISNRTNLRHNTIISSFMSLVASMFDFVTRANEMPSNRHSIVYMGATLMKHVAMIRTIYEAMEMGPLSVR